MKPRTIIVVVIVIALAGLAGFAASRFNLSALDEPGRAETYLATKGKHFLIERASRDGLPSEPCRRLAE